MLFWLKLAGIAASLFLAGLTGWRLRDDRAAHAELAVQAAVEAHQARNETRAQEVDQAHVSAVLAQAQVARTINERIHDYVPLETRVDSLITTGFVRLLNDTAAGVPTGPSPGRPDGVPAGVATDALGASIAGNYETCNVVRQQLIDLQAFERSQQ